MTHFPHTETPSAELSGVNLAFPKHGPVLKGLDWQLLPGQVVGLLGRNGCGKTTLLETLLGLREPQAGQVKLFGQDVLHLDDAARGRDRLVQGTLGPGRDHALVVPCDVDIGPDLGNVAPSHRQPQRRSDPGRRHRLAVRPVLGEQRVAAQARGPQHRFAQVVLVDHVAARRRAGQQHPDLGVVLELQQRLRLGAVQGEGPAVGEFGDDDSGFGLGAATDGKRACDRPAFDAHGERDRGRVHWRLFRRIAGSERAQLHIMQTGALIARPFGFAMRAGQESKRPAAWASMV